MLIESMSAVIGCKKIHSWKVAESAQALYVGKILNKKYLSTLGVSARADTYETGLIEAMKTLSSLPPRKEIVMFVARIFLRPVL